MKLNVLAVAVITAFAVGTANAAVPESWTVGGAAGWAHGFDHSFPSVDDGEKLKFKDDGYGIKLNGEYNFTNWFGLGLGYNFIGGQKLKATDVNTGETDTQKMHANIGEMYGRFAYPFDNNGSDVFFKVGPSFNWFSSGETKFKLVYRLNHIFS